MSNGSQFLNIRYPAMHETNTLAVLAALIEGDRWLSADAAAVYLSMTTITEKPTDAGFWSG